ncbi:MAG: hypothetical protein EOP11_16980 [Proteobacteria bacterium]|nr:MAG: hypothetical protein EOP11_16980 [Pseudomonadota bacterium]
MAHSKHPLDRIQRRLWADDLSEIIRDLQLNQRAVVSVNDVLDFLFSKRRDDPETAALVRAIQKSVHRAVVLNQRIQKLFAKHREEIEDVVYDEEEEDLRRYEAECLAHENLITEH